MTELSIHDQIDIVLTSLFTLSHGPQSAGRAKRIRTQVVALRQLCELARLQEKKKPFWQRVTDPWGVAEEITDPWDVAEEITASRMEGFNIMSANKGKKRVFDWDAIEQAAGEKIGVIYKRLGSTRDLGDYLGQFTREKTSINYCTIQSMLKARNIPSLGRGGRNNSKQNYVKPKSGRVCPVCGRDPWPNRFRCKGCNEAEDWTDGYGFCL